MHVSMFVWCACLRRSRENSRESCSCPYIHWPCGLMDKALVFGTKDCSLESCQGHSFTQRLIRGSEKLFLLPSAPVAAAKKPPLGIEPRTFSLQD